MSLPSSVRLAELEAWLNSIQGHSFADIRLASADASFRRYFRITDTVANATYVVMDAPPDKEDCRPFVHITTLLRGAGVNAPEILAMDLERGFLLLADLGDRQYLDHLDPASCHELYNDALIALVKMQRIQDHLPLYDEQRLYDEMALFEPWYLNTHLGIQLNDAQRSVLAGIFALLIDSALQQPQVFVHRDYHSRNLMLLERNNPGVLDYQDAVIGPITYDLVSLFKDCYIAWPREEIEGWLDKYLQQPPIDLVVDRDQFIRWFDLMGVQRHLKVLGIFSRLNYRDGKSQYLDDLPLTLSYVIDTCNQYEALSPLRDLLEMTVLTHSKVTYS